MVGSDHDLDWRSGAFVEHDRIAKQQLEIVVGCDRLVRVNVDGRCVLRVRIDEGCAFDIRNDPASYATAGKA